MSRLGAYPRGRLPMARSASRIREPLIDGTVISVVLCGLFFFHPAAMSLVGRAYYSVIGLNNVFAPVRLNILLQPATVLGVALLVWRKSHAGRIQFSFGRKYGIGAALAVLFAA